MTKKNPHAGQSFGEWAKQKLESDPELASMVEEEYSRIQIARRVRQLRESRKMTQLELALAIGTKQPSIARLESGKSDPSLALLQKIGRVTGHPLVVDFAKKKKSVPHPAVIKQAMAMKRKSTAGRSKRH